jgi:hypothetical protein
MIIYTLLKIGVLNDTSWCVTQGRTLKKNLGGVLSSGTEFCSICVCKKSQLFSLF